MMRAFAYFEHKFEKFGDLKLGAGLEFYNTSYQYKSIHRPNINEPGRVGLYFASGGSVNVIALSVSARYQIYTNRFYRLHAKLSPKIGYVIPNHRITGIDKIEDLMLSEGRSYFIEREGKWYSKGIFPLIALDIQNEFVLSKRSSIVLSGGYQQGFTNYYVEPMQFYRNYQTPNQTIENFTVKNKGNMIFYQISYRHYF